MITCLQGGMGNQMFQYAMGKAFALRLKTDLYLNTRRFDNDILGRRYSLGLWKGVVGAIRNDEQHQVHELGLPYNQEVADLIQYNSTLIGYWQTEKYFSDIADILREEFVPKSPLTRRSTITSMQIKDAGNRSVFLTIRRTDYLNSDFHGVLPIDYYEEALSIISKQVDPIVFVFSDDPDWCRYNLKLSYPFTIAGNFDRTTQYHLGREDEELTLMKQCKHAILANSSYSWWGAWLNPDPHRIVIAPKKWFFNANEDPRDIIPDRWIKI